METGEGEGRGPDARGTSSGRSRLGAAQAVLFVAFLALCVAPHVARLRHPSIYGDDVMRVWMLQTSPLAEQLFRPFNEHMAPVFDTVSWVTWQLAGRRLERAPVAFTAAALVPFVLALGALALLVRREAGPAAAVLAVALFNFAPVHVVETVWWYSGSNHVWAVLFTLVALLGAGPPGRWGWFAAMGGAFLAPACSAMGWLAGPVAAVRALFAPRDPGRNAAARRLASAAAPLIGSALNFAASSAWGYRRVLAASVRENLSLADGLLLAARAPASTLVPGLFGLTDVDLILPPWVAVGLTVLMLAAGLAWARVSPKRGAVLAGLALVAGGYAIIYPFRSFDGPYWGLRVARYHGFPELGLVLLVALAAAPGLRRLGLDARPLARGVFAVGLAAGLLALHAGRFRELAGLYDFADQPRVLAVLERVAALGRERGITRDQLIARLDPVQTRWDPMEGFPVQRMIPPAARLARVPDAEVKPLVLASLSPLEREALCGGMDAGPYLRPAPDVPASESSTIAEGRPAGALRVAGDRPPDLFRSEGWPSHLEYALIPTGSNSPLSARYLSVPAHDPNQGLEVWWSPAPGDWSPTRSVRWRPPDAPGVREWAVPLSSLPHWDGSRARRVRLVFRYAGRVAAGPPRLLGRGPLVP
jgi:hypothetical protein